MRTRPREIPPTHEMLENSIVSGKNREVRTLFRCVFIFISSISVCFALCVSEPHAKLRKGPSTKYPITAEVIQYTALKKIGKQKGWYRIKDVDEEIHWVREDIVTSKYQCATVKDPIANLRKGPGTKFEMLPMSPVDKYLSFRILEQKGDWLKVEDIEGDEAFILKNLVSVQ